MSYVITAPVQPSVPVVGSTDTFPVHRIYCVGRNYVDHAKEMGHTGREAPFFFMKPAGAVLPVAAGVTGALPYPPQTQDYQHEMELVVAIGKGGSDIAAADALQHVWGYAVGLDMTRRDLQGEAKKLGRPWDTGKGFEQSAPIGPITPAAQAGDIGKAAITLHVNGALRQGSTTDMLIWNVAETIADLSKYFTLQPGDLIYSGTPAGVAAVQRGDELVGAISGLTDLRVKVV
ncbi:MULTISPECIES: fumarylacetoacetate hydrolase family protein [unclassified Janthinobacterium]|uniref:fumarylacetoacetate hydrolase family protein n=1 Tax=unclassified Janthinobacterium TaxID=2610881 RepID=UPI00160A9B84|nr:MULTISPECIES: fumarylacetoacetate hydrolase family protein [unclassified Janthinobacterium]MBB5607650.1 fumarylpyruvate hydrolase [Janthinobacterium sp. S3T4]MBB5612672.1 fumarylpyruvate hydrolase [Janthinobacterium sp. S3M3]